MLKLLLKDVIMLRRRVPRLSNAVGRAEFTFHEFTTITLFVTISVVVAALFLLGLMSAACRIADNAPGWIEAIL